MNAEDLITTLEELNLKTLEASELEWLKDVCWNMQSRIWSETQDRREAKRQKEIAE